MCIRDRGKEFTVHAEFRFPIKGDGSEKLPEFQRFWDTGDSIELDSRFISKFEFPDWWKRLYGHIEITELKIVPYENTESTQFQIRFHSKRSETIVLSNVELRMEKGGEKEVTLSNGHQNTYYTTRFVINRETNLWQLNIDFRLKSIDGYQARDALAIMRFMSEGCRVVVRNLDIESEFAISVQENPGIAPDSRIVDFVDMLCRIQDELGVLFILQDGGVFASKDEEVVEQLITIFSTGRFKYSTGFSIDLAKPVVEALVPDLEQKTPVNISARSEDICVTLLGKEVSLGPSTVYIEGVWEESIYEVRSWLESAIDEDVYSVKVPRAEIIVVYERWTQDYSTKVSDHQSEITS